LRHVIITGSKAEAMYDDVLMPIFKALGVVDVKRASHIEWDGHEWVATFIETGEVIARGESRQGVVELESDWIQRRLINESRSSHER